MTRREIPSQGLSRSGPKAYASDPTANQAAAECQALGMDLASLESRLEFDAVVNTAST